MPTIKLVTEIAAPVELVFDLARSIDFHCYAEQGSGEQAVAGIMTGLIGMGDEVTFRARHFGVWQQLTSRITIFDPPRHFRDTMLRGAFHRFDHDHYFSQTAGITLMADRFEYESPLHLLGRVADVLFLERYMTAFLRERNRTLKHVAESEEWRQLLPDDYGSSQFAPAANGANNKVGTH